MTETLVHPAPPRARKPRPSLSWRYRGAVAARAFAAIVIGYFFAYACTALLSVALPWPRVDRVVAASLLSFFVWCGVAMYAFAARSAWRACWAPALGTALLFWAAKLCGAAALFPGSAPA